MILRLAATVAALALSVSASLGADIAVGFVTSLSGPGASIGIPYEKGILAGHAYADKIGDHKIKLIRLDDASDPSAATRNARKLVEEEKVDVLMGTSGVPGTTAMMVVAVETKTAMISLTPTTQPQNPNGQWLISVPQPPPLMVAAVVERMKKDNVKKAAYIGFSDSWGDLVYDALMKNVGGTSIEVVTNERYARADTSVTGQTLKIVAARPDAVITGGSGTPGALPYLALADRGYKGGLYGTHALINPDFVRVGGRDVEGVAGLPRGLSKSEQRPDHGRLFCILVRRLAGIPRCGQARAGEGRTGHAAIPRGVSRRHAVGQGNRRHPRGLQLQWGQLLRRRRPRSRAGPAAKRSMDAGALSGQPDR